MPLQHEAVYDPELRKYIDRISGRLTNVYKLSPEAVALLLLQEDSDMAKLVRERERDNADLIFSDISEAKESFGEPLPYLIARNRQEEASRIVRTHVSTGTPVKTSVRERLAALTMNPVTGIPLLLAVLYFGLYKFVGEFGAGTLVDFLEENVFGAAINPWIDSMITRFVPWPWLQDLLGREYGILTLGLRYAVAIVLPIVGTFFLMFSIIEDSGYLPRLAMLVDRVFKKIGLNGRAVIPMTLGFGCDTMATMVSRTLETKREKVIATLLLALAIPCSAQLGVILALLSASPVMLLTWGGFTAFIFLLIGWLSAKILPGEQPSFYMELPPLRMPKVSNVLVKTYTRLHWYFLEILPLFILASVLIWLGNLTGTFDVLLGWIEPLVGFIGLPPETAETFLFGFFRRDYGAAGLYDLVRTGALGQRQTVVAAATLTLFIPCVAQFIVTVKERGLKTAVGMALFIFPFAFLCGFVLNAILVLAGMK